MTAQSQEQPILVVEEAADSAGQFVGYRIRPKFGDSMLVFWDQVNMPGLRLGEFVPGFGRTIYYRPVALTADAELARLRAEVASLRSTLAQSCDEERSQMWEAGPGGGCSRAIDAEAENDRLRAEVEGLRATVARLTPKAKPMAYSTMSHCGCWSYGSYGGPNYEHKCDQHKDAAIDAALTPTETQP